MHVLEITTDRITMSTRTTQATKNLGDVALRATAIGALLLALAAFASFIYATVIFVERYAIRPDFRVCSGRTGLYGAWNPHA